MTTVAALMIPASVQSGTLDGEEVTGPTSISNGNFVIEGTFSDFDGGVFHISASGTNVEIRNGIFENNSHTSDGGVFWISGRNINFTGDYTIFTGNSVPSESGGPGGGAIKTFGGGFLTFDAEKTIFTGNTARHGGAINMGGASLTFNKTALFESNRSAGGVNSAININGGTLNIQPEAGYAFTLAGDNAIATQSTSTINIGGAGLVNLYGGVKILYESVYNSMFQTKDGFTGTLVVGQKAVNAKTVNLTGGTVVFDLMNATDGVVKGETPTGLLKAHGETADDFSLTGATLKLRARPISTANADYYYELTKVNAGTTFTLATAEDMSGYTPPATIADAEDADKIYTLNKADNPSQTTHHTLSFSLRS